MPAGASYKETHTLEQRQREAEKVRERTPDRIPVICERVKGSAVPELDKNKYLVPPDVTVGGFTVSIRRRLCLEDDKALFIFVGKTIANGNTLVSDLFNSYKDEDGFLYLTYSSENTFGGL